MEHTFQKENLQVDDVVEPLLESTEKVLVQFPFSLNLKKKVLFCSLLFFIEFPNYKIYSGCRSSGPLLPRSGSLVQLGKKSLQWVSDGENASKNMECDGEHTYKYMEPGNEPLATVKGNCRENHACYQVLTFYDVCSQIQS